MVADNKRIVVLGHEDDPHIGLVERFLGKKLEVINVGNEDGALAYELANDSPDIVVTYRGRQIDLRPESIVSIWNRRTHVRWLRPPLEVSPASHKEYALSSLQQLADPLTSLLPCDVLWVSNRQAIQKAQHKPLQLVQARRCGLAVPDTIFTSDKSRAEQFLRKHPACIIKTLASIMPEGFNQYAVVRQSQAVDLRGLELTPQIFQQAIEPDFEVRAAVIGRQVFASVVQDRDGDSRQDAEQGVRDFRTSFMKNTFRAAPFKLPSEIARACVDYVARMGLTCGYFDLIFDKKGTCWFIECNPNGQWGFVDKETVDRIAQALAALLESGQQPFDSPASDRAFG